MARAVDHDESSPRSTDTVARASILILSPSEWELESEDKYDVMTWARAQLDGQLEFSRYDRFLCFPPGYPKDVRDPDRDCMWDRLRRRLEQGAQAIFLLPPWDDAKTETSPDREEAPPVPGDAWRDAMHLLRAVVGAVPVRQPPATTLEFKIAQECPQRVRSRLVQTAADSVFEVTRGTRPNPIAWDEVLVLAGFEAIQELPAALAGFSGPGAWLVLPCSGQRSERENVSEFLDLFEDLRLLKLVHELPGYRSLPPGLYRVVQRLIHDHPGFSTWTSIEGAYRGTTDLRSKASTIVSGLRRAGMAVQSAQAARKAGEILPEDAKGYRIQT